jgi:hypothetical protein
MDLLRKGFSKCFRKLWTETQAVTFAVLFVSADHPLSSNTTISFTLNPSGSQCMKDIFGNILETYTFSFTTEDVVEKIPANAAAGFSSTAFPRPGRSPIGPLCFIRNGSKRPRADRPAAFPLFPQCNMTASLSPTPSV